MGIDACGYFKPREPLSDEALAKLNAAILECFSADELRYGSGDIIFVRPSDYEAEELGADAVVIDFGLDRYWGPHYSRGPFMKHVTVLEWVRRNVEGSRVYYTGDSDWPSSYEFTPERCQEELEHWFRNGHRGYWK